MPAHGCSQALGITILSLDGQPDFSQSHTREQLLFHGSFLLSEESSYFFPVQAKLQHCGSILLLLYDARANLKESFTLIGSSVTINPRLLVVSFLTNVQLPTWLSLQVLLLTGAW